MRRNSLKTIAFENNGFALISTEPLKKNEVFLDFSQYSILNFPTYKSIEISENRHIEDLFLSYINHSCKPNVKIDTEYLLCYALKDINAGDELTFFYPSTEWIMARPFSCHCLHAHCLGEIQGAHFLSIDILNNYYINKHILIRK